MKTRLSKIGIVSFYVMCISGIILNALDEKPVWFVTPYFMGCILMVFPSFIRIFKTKNKNKNQIMKTKLEIKNRFTGKIIFEFETENNSMKKTVEEYIRREIETKCRANLTDANLTDADLTDANLTDADLTYADLTRANLTRADLTRANLTRANLTYANLLMFKSDIWRVLLMYKTEVSGLKKAMIDGKINGSAYSGECACLKGTIANVKGCDIDLLPNVTQSTSEPCEQWFLQFKEGQTPDNSKPMKITLDWIEEFETYLNEK